jgi:hypothetical protein
MQRIYAGLFAIVGWFAVIGQYIASHDDSLASTIDYLSYFTILSNILVAVTLSCAAFAPQSSLGRFFLKPSTATAAAAYITVTGLTYYFILSSLYHLENWVLIFDRLLHYVMPPAYVLFWLLFIPKGGLKFGAAAWMLVPPLAYAAYTFVHGPWTGFYPYPFVDVATLGVGPVARNVVEFVVFFFLTGVFYVAIDRIVTRLRGQIPA